MNTITSLKVKEVVKQRGVERLNPLDFDRVADEAIRHHRKIKGTASRKLQELCSKGLLGWFSILVLAGFGGEVFHLSDAVLLGSGIICMFPCASFVILLFKG